MYQRVVKEYRANLKNVYMASLFIIQDNCSPYEKSDMLIHPSVQCPDFTKILWAQFCHILIKYYQTIFIKLSQQDTP